LAEGYKAEELFKQAAPQTFFVAPPPPTCELTTELAFVTKLGMAFSYSVSASVVAAVRNFAAPREARPPHNYPIAL
jgi:hypothetical protein